MRYLLIIVLLIVFRPLYAQKHDYVWTGGENLNNPAITGGFLIDFKDHYPDVTSHPRTYNLFQSSAGISDTSGTLMVYTNGCVIASGASDSVLENGDNINPGQVHNLYCDPNTPNTGFGYYPNVTQSSMFLPLPDSNGIYYLFHKNAKILNNPFDVITDNLYYTVVDMNQNNNEGKVVLKNIPLMHDTLAAGLMTAVKHANGKDWWIVTPRNTENQIYCFLFTHNGIVDTTLQFIGFNLDQDGSGQITFTPDGSKMITSNPYTGLGIFDFDRSTGQLSNYQSIDISPYIWQWTDFAGCAVSPNNRFVYVSSTLDLLQYDLNAPDIAASRVTVGVYDGGQNPLATTFGQCQLAPDCKIYIQTGQQAENLHVIHRPNEKGAACDFEQRGLVLTNANRGSLPYFPNYRLGPIDNPGEPCNTVTGAQAPFSPLPDFSVFPNPASDHIRVIVNQSFAETITFRLFDTAGILVRESNFNPLSTSALSVDIADIAPGIYIWHAASGTKMIQSGKIVILKK